MSAIKIYSAAARAARRGKIGLMDTTTNRRQSNTRFERLAKALIAVPKSEIDKREAEYQRKKAAKKRKVT
jgi:predicted kinase